MGPRLFSALIGTLVPVATLLLVALLSCPAPADAASKKASPATAAKKAPPKGTGNPFDILKGYWSGGGTVTPNKGNAENVSCHVTYNVAGPSVSQTMRCAGTDYKFNTSSKLNYSGGKISSSGRADTNDPRRSGSGSGARDNAHG